MPTRPHSTGLQNDCDYEELVRIDSGRKQYERDLAEHPDPRDPDYPGEEEEL